MSELDSDRVWITVKEFAAWKRVHVQTIYVMIKEARLTDYPIDRVGRAIRIGVPRGIYTGAYSGLNALNDSLIS